MIFISSSTLLTSEDHAGLVVRVVVKRKIAIPSDDSSVDDPPPQGPVRMCCDICSSHFISCDEVDIFKRVPANR